MTKIQILLDQLNVIPVFSGITFYSFTPAHLLEIISMIILLIGSGLASASEVALFSLQSGDIKDFEDKPSRKRKMVLKLLSQQDRLLATILVINNLFNIAIVIISSYFINSLIDFTTSPILGFLIQVVVVTSLILFLAEILPKVFAVENARSFSIFIAYPLYFASKLIHPLTWLLLKSSVFIQKRKFLKNQSISIADLSNAIEITSDSITDEKTILQGIVKFGSKEVSQIMHPRVDIVSLASDLSFDEVIRVVTESAYSRIPVYNETLDNIKGVVYTKDMLPYIGKDSPFDWNSLIRPAFFVPETKKIDDLLSEFQKLKNHMAIVVDEYGGTLGLVTMEDILEEIFGEIVDESDSDEEKLYKMIAPNLFLFEAKISLADFCKIVGIEDTFFDQIKGESETLAGLFLEMKGEIPRKSDRIEYKNIILEVELVDSRKIKQIKAILKPVDIITHS